MTAGENEKKVTRTTHGKKEMFRFHAFGLFPFYVGSFFSVAVVVVVVFTSLNLQQLPTKIFLNEIEIYVCARVYF